jgi:hypothetical protein
MLALDALLKPLRRLRHWSQLPPAAKAAYRRERSFVLRDDPGIARCTRESIEWLGRAQDLSTSGDGGVARHFSLIDGWGPSYPETTGYIVPTFLAFAARSDAIRGRKRPNGSQPHSPTQHAESDLDGQATLRSRTRRMLDWLVSIQLPEGGFQGGTVVQRPVLPVAFNTGQVLLGLASGAAEFGQPYLDALHRAAGWLTEAQDFDGCWRKHASPFARGGERVYDTHAAWGLLEAAKVTGESPYADAATRNIRWAIAKQRSNGWFDSCCLGDTDQPLTHTLGYALRGIIEGYRHTGERAFLEAAKRAGHGLLAALQPDGFMAGRLDANWNGAVSWACLTGTCQIAHCWLLLYRETAHVRFLDAARRANAYVRRSMDADGPPGTRGAIRGSLPIFGGYAAYQYPNWAAKFFVDANLLEEEICGSAV